jgi:transglutaminase-like putative cysteine protease
MPNGHTAGAPPREIERIFQTSLYLLLLTAFATLAGTGKLDPLGLLAVSGALIVRGIFLVRGTSWQIPDRVVSYLGLLYLAVYAIDFYLVSRNFVTASVHLVIFGVIVKLFSIHRDRDLAYLALLSFGMVLSAAILTVDSLFLGTFCVFVLISVFTFITFEMRRSAIGATNARQMQIPGLRTRRRFVSPLERLSFALTRSSLTIVAGILLTASLLFFLMPRISGGYLSRFAQQSDLTTGFGDTVNLGEIGRIQQSSEVVAHVKIDGDTTGARELRLRGAVLSQFDGVQWKNPPHDLFVPSRLQRTFILRERAAASPRTLTAFAAPRKAEYIEYQVMLEPIGTNVLFTIPVPLEITGPYREISSDFDMALHNNDRDRMTSTYRGSSIAAEPSPRDLAAARGTLPLEMPARYLKLPKLDERVPTLAKDITRNMQSDYERAAAIERYLSGRYAYTLQLPSEAPADPIADFLFHRRRGHCEYFASSMALLLRTIGIPSRIVTGFRGGEFNSITGSYIIRARDAHSWVEAYIAGAGWVTFDPTPSGPPPPITFWTRVQLYTDALREFWREWIVNYDSGHQRALADSATTSTRRRIENLRDWAHQRYLGMLEWARGLDASARNNPASVWRKLFFALLLILALSILPRAIRVIRNAMIDPARAPQRSATLWYLRMVRLASRNGWYKQPEQTPEEFADSIPDESARALVNSFIAHYERARFGNSVPDAEKLPEIYEQMRAKK